MSVYVNNYDPYNFVPRGIVNLVEGRRLPSAADGQKKVCLIGVSSNAPYDSPVAVYAERPCEDGQSGASAEELFGAGSELFLMCRAAFQAYPGVELWATPIEAPAEEEDLQAEFSFAAAGVARRVGEWTIVVHDTPITVRIESGSDPTETLNAIDKALKERGDLPFDAETTITPGDFSKPAVLVVKARHFGENGNFIDVYRKGGVAGQSLSIRRSEDGVGVNDIGTSEVSDPKGALGEMAKQRFHYIAVANTDETNLESLRDHVDRLAGPIEGKRQQAVFGLTETADESVAAEMNCARMQCVWSQGSSLTPGDLAAALSSHRAWMEGQFAAANTSGQIIAGIPRPRLPSNLADEKALDVALHDGLTPLDISGTQMMLVRSITTRCRDDGQEAPYALLDTIKITVSDFVADDVAMKMSARFNGFKLAPDTDAPIPERTATPQMIRKSLIEWARAYEALGLLHKVDAHLDEIQVEIDDEAPGRMNFQLPENVVDICAVTAGNLIRF
jgi:phage tail sheath gpL-like